MKVLFILLLLCCVLSAETRLRANGDNDLRYSVSQTDTGSQRYFENWADVTLGYENLTLNLVYEAHLPPHPSSLNPTVGQGIHRRTLGFKQGDLSLKAGNFYSVLGNGITLRTYENRAIGWDTHIDGASMDYLSDFFELKLLGGRPRDLFGNRKNSLQAGELRVTPIPLFYSGVTFLTTRDETDESTYWGSFYTKFDLPFGNIEGEFAARDFASHSNYAGKLVSQYDSAFPCGKALYVSSNWFVKDLTLLAQYKHYQGFNREENNVAYNCPPLAAKEHIFSLFNKRQLVQDADSEKGFLLEGSHPLWEDNIMTVNYSRTKSMEDRTLYREVYSQWDLEVPENWEWIAATGVQWNPEGRHLNFALHPAFPLTGPWSLKAEFQHQHTTMKFNERMFYSQHYSVSLERSPNITLSLVGEATTDQMDKSDLEAGIHKFWLGAGVNWNFLKNHDLAAFIGTRRKGKTCAGGVCAVKPELKGIELFLNSRF